MMDLFDFQREIQKNNPQIDVRLEEPMSKHTSFRIGGNAQIMVFPKSENELAAVLKICKLLDIKPAILGAGTNVLAPDEGIEGVVICLKDCLSGIELLPENRLCVMAGITMSRAAVFAANQGLSGMEFAHGIPGTVGGGVYMNAGAYGGDISQICVSADVMDSDGEVRTLSAEELSFSYRHSVLEDSQWIVVRAVFALTPKDSKLVWDRMKELLGKRSASQPLDLPSAGSAFKRPQGGYAAALIDEAGLKGFQVGGAAISTKHAGFAVNMGGATASDVRNLLDQVSEKVYLNSGIRLEPEIRIW